MDLRLAILAVLVLALGACKNDLAKVDALQDRLDVKVETVKDVEILYSNAARVKVRVTGPTMLNNLDRNEPFQEFVDGIKVDFFGDNTVVTSTLISHYAVRYERRGEIIARDSVVWQSTDGQKLETEELIWNDRDAKVYTQKFAKITTPREIIYGHGFTANQDFTDARIQQVEGIISIDKPEEE